MADKRVMEILHRLDEHYGTELVCYLDHSTDWQLLIAVILSAQCTDARVNQVTKVLFAQYGTLEKLAQASQEEIEEVLHPLGFFRAKAKNIRTCAAQLLERHGGNVPRDLESLTRLAGVGRKTANVIRGNIFGDPSIVVDTHVMRISRKLGLAKGDTPEKIEQELMAVLPEDHWILYNIQIITHGRSVCLARSPHCSICFLQDLCPYFKEVFSHDE